MKAPNMLRHEFVKHIPENLAERTVYVSITFATAAHKCACGCGNEVVTPISPTDWELTFDGRTISLYPSIGNWNLPCQSHYWIERDRVVLARGWPHDRIARVNGREQRAKQTYCAETVSPALGDRGNRRDSVEAPLRRLWRKVKLRLR